MFHRLSTILLLIGIVLPRGGVDGTFEGLVVDPPGNLPHVRGWIYVQGKNHMIRRVEVERAEIVFAENVRVSRKGRCDLECLSAGQEIRVTAEQDQSGEWRAKRIEILKLARSTI